MILRLLPYIIVFIAALYVPADSDLGWHLKYGEYFFKTGHILRNNTFSQMMHDYKWANHAWGTDLITYGIFSIFSFWGLSITAAAVITLTFFVFSKAARLSMWDEAILFPVLLFFERSVNAISFRAQLLSILFLGVEYYILTEYIRGKTKKNWFLPILFFIWANLHGQFSLGLIVFTIFCLGLLLKEIIENTEKKLFTLSQFAKRFSLLFISIIIATFLNPFGFGIYEDIFTHFDNPWQKYVAEWLPFQELSSFWWKHIIIGILILFGIFSLYFTGIVRKFLPHILVVITLYVTPFFVRRFAWSYYYLVFPLFKPLTELLKPPTRYTTKLATFILLAWLILVVILKFSLLKNPMNWQVYCQINQCSIKGAQFLKDHKLYKKNDTLFTVYNWGGFLIWNFPEIKPTIDGRMHLWRDDKGYSAFAEFYPIEQDLVNIDKTKYNIAFVSPQKNVYQRLEKLTKEGKWRLVYKDEVSGIFIRK